MRDTGTLDRLYLEWSQFTRAKTAKELTLIAALRRIVDHGETPAVIFEIAIRALTDAEPQDSGNSYAVDVAVSD